MTKKYLRSVRHLFSRRRAIQAMATLAAAGCAGDDGSGSASEGSTSGGSTSGGSSSGESTSETSTSGGSGEGSSSGTGTSTGTSGGETTGDTSTTGVAPDECADGLGMDPEELLSTIDHVIVLMMENRSFDHYFGARKLLEGEASNGLSGDESNPNFDNEPISVFKMNEFEPQDPPHEWDACHFSFNGGENNGFVLENQKANPGVEEQVMGYHVRDQLPALYNLADSFTLCDQWYASVMGPTWPNRYYLNCATSAGEKSNFPHPTIKTIWHLLVDADVSSRIYFTDVPWVAGAFPLVPTVWSRFAEGYGGFNILTLTNPYKLDNFFEDAANGALPAVTFLDPGFTSNDDHPDHNIQLGQVLIGAIYKALAESPLWEKCLFIITYDEHGGFYDHVPPPKTIDDDPEFQQLGFRVPSLVIGPTVRRGCVNSTAFEHVSVLKTIALRFGLPWLNERHAEVTDLSSCIHPDYVHDPQPPPMIAPLKVSISALLKGVGETTSQQELFDAVGVKCDAAFIAEQRAATLRLLQRAESLGAAILRP
ncbi:MAG: alkaline phosphatase family protein [Myxococcales bacterium]|nr:alkaline phosphatase family protein [Myxococcales bacterium]MCB9566734.1 alkaline phosphatase family protein [Myxococcales bacterium]